MTKTDYAKDLIQRGFKVFPVAVGAKVPPVFKGWQEKSEDCAKFVNSWWSVDDFNIGIHCKDLIVLDIDVKNDGINSLAELEDEYGLPNTLEFRTATGGRHIIYSHPDGVKNSVGEIGAGIDIRSNKGYIVAPGSTVPAGSYSVYNESPIVPAPQWLIELCNTKTAKIQKLPDDGSISDQNIAIKRAVEYLQKADVAIEGQGGDAKTFAVICRVRDLGVTSDNALEAMQDWNDRCEPPWNPEELQAKIDNAYKYAQNSAGSSSVEAMFDIVQEKEASINNEQEELVDEEIYTPDDVELQTVLNTRYIIKGWLDSDSQSLLFGHWGAGKTFISLHMAAHIAAGEEWFGNRVNGGGVLYLGYEGATAMRRRVYALRNEYPDWDLDNFKIKPMRWPLAKRNSDGARLVGQKHFERALKIFKQDTGDYPELVIIDPLRNALGGSDSDPELTAPYLAYLQEITKKYGCATMTIHHPGHGDTDRGRGDSGIEGHMDTVIKVDGVRGLIETRKQRDDPGGNLFYKLRVVEIGQDADGDMRTSCVVEPVDMNELDPGLTNEQQLIYDKLKEIAGAKELITKSQFRRAAQGHKSVIQTEIFDVLVQKHYLVAEGKQWRVGQGAAEMFS